MARDIRKSPRGLLAPLTQAALTSLRHLHEGVPHTMPDDHRARLLDLALVEEKDGRLDVTALGRERLISDR
jgi:hypothetical protein